MDKEKYVDISKQSSYIYINIYEQNTTLLKQVMKMHPITPVLLTNKVTSC